MYYYMQRSFSIEEEEVEAAAELLYKSDDDLQIRKIFRSSK